MSSFPTPATDPVAVTEALVRCPSVTPAEAGALDVLEALLVRLGFHVERPVFREDGTPDVENLYARLGEAAPVLVFAGHVDVVPPGEVGAWTHPPFAAARHDGMLWGRGVADMKGGVAAAVAAVARVLAERGRPAGSIAFLITGDEEGPAVNGTVKLLDWAKARGERFDHCILPEPTNPNAMGEMIKIGRRGSLTGRLTVLGVQGHVAYPHLARNPIDGMIRLLAALKAAPLDGGTAHFAPSTLEISTVDVGNPAANVIPQRATATFNVRFNDAWTPDSLAAELSSRIAAAAQGSPPVTYDLAFQPTNATAFVTEPGAFVEMMSEVVARETNHRPELSTTGGTSDARFIKDHCPVLEFGLVGQTMHKVDERVAEADIETLTRIFERVIERYFAG